MTSQTERRVVADRRDYTLSTFKSCLVAPRRMHGRRAADRRYGVLDRFEGGVVALAILLMVLSVLDAVFTLTLIARGGTEVNPFMNALLNHSVWAFTGFKMLLTGLPAIFLVATANVLLLGRYRSRSVLAALVGLYIGLMMYHFALLYISA